MLAVKNPFRKDPETSPASVNKLKGSQSKVTHQGGNRVAGRFASKVVKRTAKNKTDGRGLYTFKGEKKIWEAHVGATSDGAIKPVGGRIERENPGDVKGGMGKRMQEKSMYSPWLKNNEGSGGGCSALPPASRKKSKGKGKNPVAYCRKGDTETPSLHCTEKNKGGVN